jgi:SAM-dependent methyltransferase
MKFGMKHSFGKEYFGSAYCDYTKQNPERKMLFYKRLVEQLPKRALPASILDIGCAFGTFLAAVDSSWRRFGIDISEYALRTASKRTPGAHFIVADAAFLPVNYAVDTVVAFDCLEHVENLETAAAGINKTLSATGYFIFVVPVYDGPLGPVIRLLDHDSTHIHKKPREFWLRWTEAHFKPCQWRGIVRYFLPGGIYLHAATKILRRFTPAIVVVARKK